MPGKEIPESDGKSAAAPEQESKAGVVMTYAKVSLEERDLTDEALLAFGFKNVPDGYRGVMQVFRLSERVQEAVKQDINLAFLDAPKSAAEPAA